MIYKTQRHFYDSFVPDNAAKQNRADSADLNLSSCKQEVMSISCRHSFISPAEMVDLYICRGWFPAWGADRSIMTPRTKRAYRRMSIWGLLGLLLFILEPLFVINKTHITRCICACCFFSFPLLRCLLVFSWFLWFQPQGLQLFTEILLSTNVHQISHWRHLCWSKAIIY